MKKRFAVFLLLLAVLMLPSCSSKEKSITGIKEIKIEDMTEKTFGWGSVTDELRAKVKHKGEFDKNDIVVVIDDEDILNINFQIGKKHFFSTYIDFEVEGLKEGTTSFFFKTSDDVVKSETIKITVEKNVESIEFEKNEDLLLYKGEVRHDNYFKINASQEITIPKNVVECVSEDKNIVTVDYDESYSPFCFKINCFRVGETYIYLQTKDKTIQSQKIKVTVREPTADDVFDKSRAVYVTPHGTKYHYDKACAGKNGIETTENEAIINYEPCKRCAR